MNHKSVISETLHYVYIACIQNGAVLIFVSYLLNWIAYR